jgi:hypothetical protein
MPRLAMLATQVSELGPLADEKPRLRSAEPASEAMSTV